MNSPSLRLLPLLLALGLAGCTATPPSGTGEQRVSLMTWNVENLFDTVHDEGKEDFAYLPRSVKQAHPEYLATCARITVAAWRDECENNDWTDARLDEKLTRLAEVIGQIGNGRGPDILLLEEVENLNVVDMLNARLGKSDYQTRVLLEGWDERGIDTAVLSRLPQWDRPILHKVPYRNENGDSSDKTGKTRGILEVRLLLPDGQKASVFAVHLPSGGGPGYLRRQAVDYLAELKRQLPADVLPIVGGDFNINAGEERQHRYIADRLASTWSVSHLIGCNDCKGSYYYHRNREWSFFDMLLFPQQMTTTGFNGWKVDPASIRLPHQSRYQVNKWGSPARFEGGKYPEGVSDHWPMYAEIHR
ncbi:endonuclease/exonuclease/phosphatase family protein [Pseudomonas huaxiensis]|uniref:endonuclease/exonuclease/phosphatase family protein n=1 Tax=Pseudomonas huaxiensis TaxID=2213017 RepID=UPI001CDD5054|nr:endonuclease/exonuclease/phosphatase family protein [Pseudomonas huaxiensis]